MKSSAILKNHGIKIAMFIYVILSIGSLTYFPFMHSDEGWLASLSRSMITEKDIGATEDFFHEASRNPHAIKSLFHIFQIPFITASFSLISVRILSFLVGLVTLFFFFKTSLSIFNNKKHAWLLTLLLAMDIQFIYISHFARQEIFILLVFSICLWFFYKPIKKWSFKNDIIMGALIGISIGFHPNIFIIATGFIFIYIFYSIHTRFTKYYSKPGFLNTLLFVLLLGFFGLIFIGISQILDPEFISNYLNFGANHGVTNSFYTKLLKLPRFYEKMFSRISGTYYLPDIRIQLVVFTVSFLFLIPVSLIFKKNRSTIISLLVLMMGINTGIIFIGKYSPPSIIFIFIPGYFVTFAFLKAVISPPSKLITYIFLLIFILTTSSVIQITPWRKNNYNNYIQKIRAHVPKESGTLANLNSIFAFSPEKLFSYRDLLTLNPELSFREYIKKYNIEYIVYSDELEIIFNERPVWNTMYGNIYPWYEDMMSFIRSDCKELYQWSEPVFGMRITTYMGKLDSNISIFKIIN